MNVIPYTDPTRRSFVWKIEVPLQDIIDLDLDLHDRQLLDAAMQPKELPGKMLEALTMLVEKLEKTQPSDLERLKKFINS